MTVVDLLKARRDAVLLLDMPDMAAQLVWNEAAGRWVVYIENGPAVPLHRDTGEEEAVQALLGLIAMERQKHGDV